MLRYKTFLYFLKTYYNLQQYLFFPNGLQITNLQNICLFQKELVICALQIICLSYLPTPPLGQDTTQGQFF